MEPQQIGFLVILALALYLFASEKLRVDVTAMLVLLALVVTGVLAVSYTHLTLPTKA